MTNGAEDTFLAAYEMHSDALFRHAFFRLSDRERALELTQDKFVKAWDYVRAGGDVRQPKSFMFRIMNNLIIDEYRRSKTESLDKKLEDNPAFESALSESSLIEVEEGMDEVTLMGHVRTAISKLPEDYRSAVTMRYIDGFSPKEIARLIGSTENVVSVRIHRGLQKLKSELKTQP